MQSGVAIRSNENYVPPTRLRLRIVEMAEKRSRNGSGNRFKRETSNVEHFRQTRDIDKNLAQLKNVEREIIGDVYDSSIKVMSNKEKINLDLPTQTKSRQRQQQYASYHKIVVVDKGDNKSQREHPSAWLLPRFNQRNSLGTDNCNKVFQGTQEPNNTHVVDKHLTPRNAEPTKRYRAVSGKLIEKDNSRDVPSQNEKEPLSKTPEDAVSLAPTSHFPSNGSADAKKIRGLEVSGAMDGNKLNGSCAKENKDVTPDAHLERGKQTHPSRVYELKGNALTTPPPRQSSARKPGIFSASLEAFRRRLRLTANKYSDRLNNEKIDRTEEYLIRPEPQTRTLLTPHPPHTPRQGTLTPSPQRRNHCHQKHPFETGRRNLKRNKMNLQSFSNVSDQNNYVHHNNNNKSSIQAIAEADSDNKVTNMKSFAARRNSPIHGNFVALNTFEGISSKDHIKRSATKDQCLKKEDTPADEDSDVLPSLANTKTPMANVKTYVVMSKPVCDRNQPTSTPVPPPRKVAPFTEHNLRLHDSLQAMFERRAQRMARFQRRQLQQTMSQRQQNGQQNSELKQQHDEYHQNQKQPICKDENISIYDSDTSEESANNHRIWRWIVEATKQATFENPHAESTEIPLQPQAVLSRTELPVDSAIQFEESLNIKRVACC
ncbi:hypothetical protein PoB_000718000 [Plakobranchus ocellatus]|uniref:Uncharacterized protein n=1 Tax=Plakobranchus ocellatus TaxID=259542 RepID=A0AAV3YCA5_9GAST|nr:hypothetical protein PoB_000718000 [Plakobranchus ocellatus]